VNKRTLLILAALLGIGLTTSWLIADSRDLSTKEIDSPRDKDNSALLETIGTMGASHLYQTYLNVGLLADGRAEGIYDTATAQQVLGTLLGLVDAVDKQLDQLAKSNLSREDKQALEQITKQSALLRQMAAALEAFWKSNKKEDGAKYEKLRQQSWAGVQKLLGLDQES
jgi:hypothetical protein